MGRFFFSQVSVFLSSFPLLLISLFLFVLVPDGIEKEFGRSFYTSRFCWQFFHHQSFNEPKIKTQTPQSIKHFSVAGKMMIISSKWMQEWYTNGMEFSFFLLSFQKLSDSFDFRVHREFTSFVRTFMPTARSNEILYSNFRRFRIKTTIICSTS